MKRLYFTEPKNFVIKDDEEEYLKKCYEPVKIAYENYQKEIIFKEILLKKVGYEFKDNPLIERLDSIIISKRIEFEMLMKLSKFETEQKLVMLPIYVPVHTVFKKKYVKISLE